MKCIVIGLKKEQRNKYNITNTKLKNVKNNI